MWVGVACGLALCWLAWPVQAQEKAETVDNRDHEARALFEAGRSAYTAGRYEDALVEFQRAFERSARPELLYNVGLAAMQLGRDELALDALQRFVTSVPQAPNAEAATLRIQLLRTRMAEEGAVEAQSAAPSDRGEADRGTLRALRYTWVAAGLSIALGATSLGLGIKAQHSYEALRDSCLSEGMPTCTRDDVGAGNLDGRALATNVLAAGAGAALVTAVVLFFVEKPRSRASSSARLAPAGLGLAGSF